MPFISHRAQLKLNRDEVEALDALSRSVNETSGRRLAAEILLRYHAGGAVSAIARALGISRPRVERCIRKALDLGITQALAVMPGRGRRPLITAEAQKWVSSLAALSPVNLGHPQTAWTTRLLAGHIREHCREAGHSSLERIAPGTVARILRATPSDSARSVRRQSKASRIDVLYFRRLIETRTQESGLTPLLHKLPNRFDQLPAQGALFLFLGMDLASGEVLSLIRMRSGREEFVELLRLLDSHYQPGARIRVTLDKDLLALSKQTRDFLQTIPNRFELKSASEESSSLNLIELLFDKTLNCLLLEPGAQSREELRDQIDSYFSKMNKMQMVTPWL